MFNNFKLFELLETEDLIIAFIISSYKFIKQNCENQIENTILSITFIKIIKGLRIFSVFKEVFIITDQWI